MMYIYLNNKLSLEHSAYGYTVFTMQSKLKCTLCIDYHIGILNALTLKACTSMYIYLGLFIYKCSKRK